MIYLKDLTEFLDPFFLKHQYDRDPGGIYRESDRPIHRLGLLLEPFPEIDDWIHRHDLDALFLHRPWKLENGWMTVDRGVIFYHLAFDERLTLGFNLRLADALSMTNIQPFGEKENRTIGMIGEIPPQPFDRYINQVHQVFNGYTSIKGTQEGISKVAVVGAMTDDLIREAAAQNVTVYITGQFREAAAQAVLDTGIAVIEIGHRRCEEWGLRSLSNVLRERWATLKTVVALK